MPELTSGARRSKRLGDLQIGALPVNQGVNWAEPPAQKRTRRRVGAGRGRGGNATGLGKGSSPSAPTRRTTAGRGRGARLTDLDPEPCEVGVIGNLVHSSPEIKKEVLLAGALQPVICLLSSCCLESQRVAALLIGQFATTDSDCKIHIGQRGAINPLIDMLESSDLQLREMSTFAFNLPVFLFRNDNLAVFQAHSRVCNKDVKKIGREDARASTETHAISSHWGKGCSNTCSSCSCTFMFP
ncbi:hypothetical protein P8452_66808 [Trifolium repens]|nr:hypothetical protein P8452_66808 [Trifolium repens]